MLYTVTELSASQMSQHRSLTDSGLLDVLARKSENLSIIDFCYLSYLLDVCGDRHKEAIRETEHYVAITKPTRKNDFHQIKMRYAHAVQ